MVQRKRYYQNSLQKYYVLCCNKRFRDIWNEYLLITASVFIYFISHWASADHFLRDSFSHLMINHYVLLQLQLEDPWELCNEFESLIAVEHTLGIDSINQNSLVRVWFGIGKNFLIINDLICNQINQISYPYLICNQSHPRMVDIWFISRKKLPSSLIYFLIKLAVGLILVCKQIVKKRLRFIFGVLRTTDG